VQLHEIKTHIATVEQTITKSETVNKSLQKKVDLLHDDNYLQQLIRDKYMYTKKGEVVYNLPSSDPDSNKD
jgi:cell division protein DivIC